MASTAIKLNTLPAAEGTSIGTALGEVATAFHHLTSALLRSVFVRETAPARPLTAFEEAEALRSYASEIQAQDPDFALDLFCAADRHETEAAQRA